MVLPLVSGSLHDAKPVTTLQQRVTIPMVVKELLLETTYGLTAPAILAMALAALCPVARISVVKTENAEKKAEINY